MTVDECGLVLPTFRLHRTICWQGLLVSMQLKCSEVAAAESLEDHGAA
jgi:hypothetical protein